MDQAKSKEIKERFYDLKIKAARNAIERLKNSIRHHEVSDTDPALAMQLICNSVDGYKKEKNTLEKDERSALKYL